jgi:hypothetical protein
MISRSKRLLAFGLIGICNYVAAETLYVFVPTDVRANVLQEKIEAACPGVSITVFGRSKDFLDQIKGSPPDAILTLLPVIQSGTGFQSSFQGIKNGEPAEPYLLVSKKDKPLDIKSLAGTTIGVIDLLGRKEMTEFVQQILQQAVKVKRVTKQEDLLPLLTFDAADAIFVSRTIYEALKQKSQLDLIETELNVRLGLTSAATTSDSVKQRFGSCIQKFDAELNATLGVEKWTEN